MKKVSFGGGIICGIVGMIVASIIFTGGFVLGTYVTSNVYKKENGGNDAEKTAD